MAHFMETNIGFLKGVGPAKAKLLKEELGISTFYDLIHTYPFRHEDRSKFHTINALSVDDTNVQIKGQLKSIEITGQPRQQRLKATFADDTGQIELVWFKGVSWIAPKLKKGVTYIAYGKISLFNSQFTISHPELEVVSSHNTNGKAEFIPVYHTTDKLKKRHLDSKAIVKLQKTLFQSQDFKVGETVDTAILEELNLMS